MSSVQCATTGPWLPRFPVDDCVFRLLSSKPAAIHAWRRLLLRCFGARIGRGVFVYSSARIWAPWNLTMEDESCLGYDVDCYCVAPIVLGRGAVVSQYCHLCSASHDYTRPGFPLIAGPIRIGATAWIAAGAFVGPGVNVGAGAVAGARAVITKDVEPWTVVAGNPAVFIKRRDFQGKPAATQDRVEAEMLRSRD